MKSFSCLVFVCLGAAWAQQAPPSPASTLPNLPEQTVVAVFEDGTKFTMGELKLLYPALPPQLQQAVMRDPAEFFREYAIMRKYNQMAESKKLDQQNPYKEAIMFSRMFILYQAQLDDTLRSAVVEPAEVINYYDSHKDSFKQVRLKAIYIPFVEGTAGSGLTEDQAQAKAKKLVATIKGGADFVAMVKENSEDETSKAKDGEFATLRASDQVPDAIRSVVFTLKQGEISDPVRQPHGYYIFRAEEVTARPLSQVRDQIFTDLKQQHARDWVTKMNNETKVEFPNPAFPAAKQQTPAPIVGK